MHGGTLRRARFVNDAFKEPANGGVRQRAGIMGLGILQNFFFALGLVEREIRFHLEAADFQGAFGALVEKLDKFSVDFVDALAPFIELHRMASRRERPLRPASLRDATRVASADAAESTEEAFSISATSAEPTTAASASPPRRETCPGKEMPKPTAIGSFVLERTRRSSAGTSSDIASLAPVTPVREMR